MGEYRCVLDRLVQFRKTLDLTQSQMAEKLHISQEQYSYLENGKVKITAEILGVLFALGLDINFLISGAQNSDYCHNELTDMFNRMAKKESDNKVDCELKRILAYLLNLLVMKETKNKDKVINEVTGIAINEVTGTSTNEITSVVANEVANVARVSESKNQKLLGYLNRHWNEFTTMAFVREELGLSQVLMAEELGLGIKKYRKLEKEVIYPDAELLFELCKRSGCAPMLFLDLCDRKMYIMERFWGDLTRDIQLKIMDILHNVYHIL